MVGSGSAGAIIAARMTERSENQVLLVEAGPDYPELKQLPGDLIDGTRNSMHKHDWGYQHHPAPNGLMLPMPRGRVVGGSSAVNTCIALRGHPADYEEWAALGLPDWSWDKCLPAFKRLEDDRDFRNEWHGQGGPIPVRRHTAAELIPWQSGFMEACRQAGLPECDDSNDPTKTGYGPHAMNKINGVRMSASRGYLTAEVRARPNFSLVADTLVHRVVLTNRRVTGIEVERFGERKVLPCKRVVLSAGALATPGILLRSGIGPRADVERLGATLVAEVPAVGSRLLDHPGAALFFWPRRGYSARGPIVQTVYRFTSKGSTVPNDMQIQPGSFAPLPKVTLPLFTIAICVGKPYGAGTLRYRSADPRAPVDIESNFFVDARDRAMVMEALTIAVELARSKSIRQMGWHFWPLTGVAFSSPKLEAWVSKYCGSGYHPCGTVPMGADGASNAATDGRGRVRGVEGLIVADASLMPTITSANTNFPTLMMGERFGEWLRDGQI